MDDGLNVLKPQSTPPRATTEIIETLAFALGFSLLWAYGWLFNLLLTFGELFLGYQQHEIVPSKSSLYVLFFRVF